MTEFENLLESLVPGAGRKDAHDAEAPGLPQELGLEPRGILGRGGTGWVFKAWDPVMEREVAVKVARADGGAAARLALLDEARRATRLRHPAVLPVHRVTVVGGQLYVEWQLAPEQTLEVWLSDPERLQAMGVASRLLVLRDVARALVRAHAQGIVHGDLHPANIAIGPADAVYVLDWSGSSQAGRLQGNPSHAAVDCLHGAPATAASDIFSLGAIAWELVCRRALRPR
ncbi:MAG: protein kinase, partial [Myxococcota bacterium]